MADKLSARARNDLLKYAQQGNLTKLKAIVTENVTDDSIFTFCHDRSGDNMVILAARHGRLPILEYLFGSCGQAVEQTNSDGKRPLHESAQNGHIECVRYLLSLGAQIDSLKRADWTPLMLACTKPRLDVIETLVAAGASLQLFNKDGWNAFHIACREGHVDIVQYLLHKDSETWNSISKNGRSPLHTAALHGHVPVVQLLLQKARYPVDQQDSCGSTPLMDALRAGYTQVADVLIEEHQANIHCADNLGRQALHLVAGTGSIKSLNYLIKIRGVDVNTVSSVYGTTALHIAAKENQHEALEVLLTLGADLNITDNKGRTPLHIASGSQAVECVQILLHHGARDCADASGNTALSLARKPQIKEALAT